MTNIKIFFEDYNRKERQLLNKNYPKAYRKIYPKLNQVKGYSFEDFKTYSVFRQQQERKGFKSFTELSLKSFKWDLISDFFIYKNENLNSIQGLIPTNNVPETLGVATSLTIASDIYGLTQADWQNIPIPKKGSGPDFDFKISSNGSHFVVLESKGSIVHDNSKSSSVSIHKHKIKKKKNDAKFKIKYPGDVCFGIIAAADPTHTLKAWITDPDMPEINISPQKVKLIKRLTYYYHILRTISPRSFLTITLGNRIKEIQVVDNYESLSQIPLLGYNENPIEVYDGFITSKTHDIDNQIIGKVFTRENDIYVVGVNVDILKSIASMNFNEINNYKKIPRTSEKLFYLKPNKGSKTDRMMLEIGLDGDIQGNKSVRERMIPIIQNSAGLIFSKVN